MPAEPAGAGDPASCSALASRLTGMATRVGAIGRALGQVGDAEIDAVGTRLDDVDTELDEVVTDLVTLADAVQRLAVDLSRERAPGGPTVRERTRTGRSQAAVERVARRVSPLR